MFRQLGPARCLGHSYVLSADHNHRDNTKMHMLSVGKDPLILQILYIHTSPSTTTKVRVSNVGNTCISRTYLEYWA